MAAVEAVELGLPRLPPADHSLGDEAICRPTNSLLRASSQHLMDTAPGELLFGAREHAENITVQGRRHHAQGTGEVHR